MGLFLQIRSSLRGAQSPRVAAVSAVLLFAIPLLSAAQPTAGDRPQILALFADSSTLPANVRILEGLLSQLDEAYGSYDFYVEYRDVNRFAGPEADAMFLNQIVTRYREKPIDALLLLGPAMLEFGRAHRSDFAPGVPLLFGAVSSSSSLDGAGEGMRGVVSEFDLQGTLAFARRLQPDARRVVVFTGTSNFDRSWEAAAREIFAELSDLPVEYVTDLTLDGFKASAAALGPETILIILTIFQDGAGDNFLPRTAAAEIARVSSAPTYSVYDTFIEDGVLGGRVQTFETLGREISKLAVSEITGGAPGPRIVRVESRAIVNWSQLARYGLDPSLLPEDAVLLNHQPSAWERYRSVILLVAFVLAIQTATIALLLLQRRLRRQAEEQARARQLELNKANRILHLGELSGALAHELSQPLTAILANAQAGTEIASKSPVDLEEIRAILADIVEDDTRAATLIAELRQLMSNQAPELSRVSLNTVVRDTLRLARSELMARETQVVEQLSAGPVNVEGDSVQLQQVVLNLLLNAAEAMAETPPERRRITISTNTREDGWRELALEDAGEGLNGEDFDPFRPFATTKATGLGLGLSISRTIAEAHGGRIGFDRSVSEGARVVLSLPPP